jgi:alkylation response protein AidB-like acyl-CoA dehydrogenase
LALFHSPERSAPSPGKPWLGGTSAVHDTDWAPLVTGAGLAQLLLAIWPADQARIIVTWDGLGLRGTGSGDFEVTDIFVPQEQVNPGFYARRSTTGRCSS